MNLNLLICALFNKHKYDKGTRLDDVQVERHCICCHHKVVISRSITKEKVNEVISYLREGSYSHAKMSLDITMKELGYK